MRPLSPCQHVICRTLVCMNPLPNVAVRMQAASVREAAGGATVALMAHLQARSVPTVVACLLDGMASSCAWQTKVRM